MSARSVFVQCSHICFNAFICVNTIHLWLLMEVVKVACTGYTLKHTAFVLWKVEFFNRNKLSLLCFSSRTLKQTWKGCRDCSLPLTVSCCDFCQTAQILWLVCSIRGCVQYYLQLPPSLKDGQEKECVCVCVCPECSNAYYIVCKRWRQPQVISWYIFFLFVLFS